jgi:pimeloyl-ACP methyl ester carboxylesterase
VGIYERGLRTVWRAVVSRAEASTAQVSELGGALPEAGAGRSPVLLVGGYANDERSVGALARSLVRDGFDARTMTLPQFGMGDILEQGAAIRTEVARIRAETGANHVDVVGYSSGGYAARSAQQLDDGGDAGIGRVVTLVTGNEGLDFGLLNPIIRRIAPAGIRQVVRGSELIDQLHATTAGHDVVSVGTTGFDLVVPSARREVITDKPFIPVDVGRRLGPFSRVTHLAVTRDARTYELVRGALLSQPAG